MRIVSAVLIFHILTYSTSANSENNVFSFPRQSKSFLEDALTAAGAVLTYVATCTRTKVVAVMPQSRTFISSTAKEKGCAHMHVCLDNMQILRTRKWWFSKDAEA